MIISQQNYQLFYKEKSQRELNIEKNIYVALYTVFVLGFVLQTLVILGIFK